MDRDTYILVELLGRNDPQVQALLRASADPNFKDVVPTLLRTMCMKRGIDPDNPPAFGMPDGLSPSDYPLGRAKCGKTLGEEVGLAQVDFQQPIGVVGAAGAGKSTLVKLLILSFTGKIK